MKSYLRYTEIFLGVSCYFHYADNFLGEPKLLFECTKIFLRHQKLLTVHTLKIFWGIQSYFERTENFFRTYLKKSFQYRDFFSSSRVTLSSRKVRLSWVLCSSWIRMSLNAYFWAFYFLYFVNFLTPIHPNIQNESTIERNIFLFT